MSSGAGIPDDIGVGITTLKFEFLPLWPPGECCL